MNAHRYSRRAAAALTLSRDPLAAALVAAAAELAGFRPEFAHAGETLRATLLRVRPSHVLLDCDDPDLRDAAVLGPALMTGARLFYYGSAHGVADVRLFAARHQVRLIVLPDDIHRLREILTRRPSPTREQVPR